MNNIIYDDRLIIIKIKSWINLTIGKIESIMHRFDRVRRLNRSPNSSGAIDFWIAYCFKWEALRMPRTSRIYSVHIWFFIPTEGRIPVVTSDDMDWGEMETVLGDDVLIGGEWKPTHLHAPHPPRRHHTVPGSWRTSPCPPQTPLPDLETTALTLPDIRRRSGEAWQWGRLQWCRLHYSDADYTTVRQIAGNIIIILPAFPADIGRKPASLARGSRQRVHSGEESDFAGALWSVTAERDIMVAVVFIFKINACACACGHA